MRKKVVVRGNSSVLNYKKIFEESNALNKAIEEGLPFGSYKKLQSTTLNSLYYKDDAYTLLGYYEENNKLLIDVEFKEKNMNYAKEFIALPEIYFNALNNKFDVCAIDITCTV